MKNIINIDAASGIYSVTKESGADAVIILYKNITVNDNQLEIYHGNRYHGTIGCRYLNQTAQATLPSEIFTGHNIHFRLITKGIPGEFYHIIYKPDNSFVFEALNEVIYSNEKGSGYLIQDIDFNKYEDLQPFTQDQLEAYDYKTLRGGKL